MPTGLIDCIVHFFLFCGELLIMAHLMPCGILMLYRITMLYRTTMRVQYHDTVLYHCHIVPHCTNSTRMYQEGTRSLSI